MNPNQLQAVEDEEEGIEEVEEDIDYDALYGGEDIDMSDYERPPEVENSYAKIFGDVVKQGGKEFLIGAGGAYGDLAELAGVNQESPSDKIKSSTDFDTLDRINEENPNRSFLDTFAQINSLGDESGQPSFKAPTSQNLRDVNDAIGGPGEPETIPGRYAARTAKLYGTALPFGQVNPLPAVAAGVAGQTAEEAGADPLLQAAIEIVTSIVSPGKGGKTGIESAKKANQARIEELKKLGYNDEQITLAINSAYKDSKKAKIASKGDKTERAFEIFTEHSEKTIDDILSSQIKGYEKGSKHVHEMASDAYGQVAREASNLVIRDSTPFINSATGVVKELRKNLGKNPDAESFLSRLHQAVVDSTKNPTAENYMNFYKELNSMGKWVGRAQRDRLITQVKDGIKDTFKGEGPQGKALAKKFEKANQGIVKAYKAEEISDLLLKSTTQDGKDFKKMYKIFDDPENVKLFEDVLGAAQTKNVRAISKVGKEIKDFDKSWKKAGSYRKFNSAADVARATAASYYIYQQDWHGLAGVLATKAASGAVKKLAEQSLRNPKFQNIMIRGLHAIKNSSPILMKSADEAMKKYLDEQGIEIDLN